MLRIYGASDDLVEFEGIVNDEENCIDKDVLVVVGSPEAKAGENASGVRVRMRYGANETATWSAEIEQFDEDAPIPWPVRVEARGYSVHVVIDCPEGTPVTWTKKKAKR